MNPPPHAPYERNESGHFGSAPPELIRGLSSHRTQDKDKLFKKYSRTTGKEFLHPGEQEGETLFRYVDRVRLVFDMITQRIDTCELEKMKIIEADFPLHNQKQIEEFQSQFSSVKSAFKIVDLMKLRNFIWDL